MKTLLWLVIKADETDSQETSFKVSLVQRHTARPDPGSLTCTTTPIDCFLRRPAPSHSISRFDFFHIYPRIQVPPSILSHLCFPGRIVTARSCRMRIRQPDFHTVSTYFGQKEGIIAPLSDQITAGEPDLPCCAVRRQHLPTRYHPTILCYITLRH